MWQFAFDTTARQAKKNPNPKLAKIQAIELAMEEFRKGKMPAKRITLPNPLFAEIQSEAILVTLKILEKKSITEPLMPMTMDIFHYKHELVQYFWCR